MAEETKETKKEAKASYELIDVPTQTAVMIRNVVTGDVMDMNQALAQLLNDVAAIKKAVA